MATWGYVRVSTDRQNTENQKIAILEFANAKEDANYQLDRNENQFAEVSKRKKNQ